MSQLLLGPLSVLFCFVIASCCGVEDCVRLRDGPVCAAATKTPYRHGPNGEVLLMNLNDKKQSRHFFNPLITCTSFHQCSLPFHAISNAFQVRCPWWREKVTLPGGVAPRVHGHQGVAAREAWHEVRDTVMFRTYTRISHISSYQCLQGIQTRRASCS